MPRTQHRITLAALALAAMLLLCLAATHAHQPGDHAECWLCTASVGHVAITATTFVLGVFWVFLFGISIARPTRQQSLSHLPKKARAPPAFASI